MDIRCRQRPRESKTEGAQGGGREEQRTSGDRKTERVAEQVRQGAGGRGGEWGPRDSKTCVPQSEQHVGWEGARCAEWRACTLITPEACLWSRPHICFFIHHINAFNINILVKVTCKTQPFGFSNLYKSCKTATQVHMWIAVLFQTNIQKSNPILQQPDITGGRAHHAKYWPKATATN